MPVDLSLPEFVVMIVVALPEPTFEVQLDVLDIV